VLKLRIPLRSASPWEVYRKIASGDVFYYSVTLPEGYNIRNRRCRARTGTITRQEFRSPRGKAAGSPISPRTSRHWSDSYFDTYRFSCHTTAEDLRDRCSALPPRMVDVTPTVPRRTVCRNCNLGILVEKETPCLRTRDGGSVFRNRLRIGMALQCDPTVIYALELAGRYRGKLVKEDLAVPSPYNTYTHAGLPPGPIASPGRASLAAALEPAATDYLYFVADNHGGHTFSANLAGHSEAVARYRRQNGRKKQNTGKPKMPAAQSHEPAEEWQKVLDFEVQRWSAKSCEQLRPSCEISKRMK
jgi:UPF0755 protein